MMIGYIRAKSMDNYTKDLEKQNAELQEKLAGAQLKKEVTQEFKVFMAHYIKALTAGGDYIFVFKEVSESRPWLPQTVEMGLQVIFLVPEAKFK